MNAYTTIYCAPTEFGMGWLFDFEQLPLSRFLTEIWCIMLFKFVEIV